MLVQGTVVFADLSGSTALYETLGNAKAADAVTRLTQWICQIFELNTGRVIKTLGDGVLGIFSDAQLAVGAMADMQRGHRKRLSRWPPHLQLDIRVGIASGEVVEVDGDCYGDAVNVASRLSDLAGAHQILVTDAVVELIPLDTVLRFRGLGAINVRGRTEAPVVYQVEWEEEAQSDFLTMQPPLLQTGRNEDPAEGRIQLAWLDKEFAFRSAELPVHLGRSQDAQICINDPRVSRLHAKIDWRFGQFVLIDLSSFGTWVRFGGSDSDVALRREECLLHGSGEIGLGLPCSDLSAPTVRFSASS